MKSKWAAAAAAGTLLAGIAAAGPALAQSASITLLCSPDTNGGTLVNGVCVLPSATPGQPYEAFLLTSNGAVDTFTITSGSLPPGLSMPATFGAATPSTNGTYSITVGASPPLTISFPATCCNAGQVGVSYLQNFFSSGGTGPFTWTVTGKLPPGVAQPAAGAPRLTGTPTRAGTFAVTVKVTDSAGNHATESGSITIAR